MDFLSQDRLREGGKRILYYSCLWLAEKGFCWPATTTLIVVNQRRDQSQDFRIAAIELDAMPAKE